MRRATSHPSISGLIALCVSWIITGVVTANNGYVATSRPLENIVIDGDLSDWPDSLKKYPITCNHQGVAPTHDGDLNAWFMVGHDVSTNRLLVACVVEDDSAVLQSDGEGQLVLSRDGMGVYVGTAHGEKPTATNDAISILGDYLPNNESVDSQVVRTPTGHSYEYAIDLDRFAVGVDKNRPYTIPFDVHVSDKDSDGSISIRYWTPNAWKARRSERVGDLIINVPPNELGTVNGHVIDPVTKEGLAGTLIRYVAVGNPNLVADIVSDAKGRFTATLPGGTYERSTPEWPEGSDTQRLTVVAGSGMDDTISPPRLATRFRPIGRGTRASRQRPPDISPFDLRDGVSYFATSNYTRPQGIPNGNNWDLVVDPDGVIWSANALGLVRLEGEGATTYGRQDGLPGDAIRALLLDGDFLWVGGRKGLVRLARRSGELERFPEFDGNHIFDINRLHDGRVGICTLRGFFAIDVVRHPSDPARITAYGDADGFTERRILSCHADPSGEFTWIGTDDGLSLFDGERVSENLTPANGIPDSRIWEICCMSDGSIWFGANRSIFRFDGKDFSTVSESDTCYYAYCGGIAEGRDGLVWCVTEPTVDKRVLLSFDSKKPENALQTLPISSLRLQTDTFGNLWASGAGFISRIDLTHAQVSGGKIGEICVAPSSHHARRKVWFSAQQDGNWYLCYTQDAEANSPIMRFQSDERIDSLLCCLNSDSRVWVGTESRGLQLFDGSDFRYPDDAIQFPDDKGTGSSRLQWPTDTRVLDLLRLTQGEMRDHILCATYEGIYVIRDGKLLEFHPLQVGGQGTVATQMSECDDGRVICLTDSGILFLDPVTGTTSDTIDIGDGLRMENVVCIESSGADQIWIGTQTGLFEYKSGVVSRYSGVGRLARTQVTNIATAPNGDIWIASELGVTQFCPKTNLSSTRLQNDKVSTPEQYGAIAFTADKAWIGSSFGLTRCTTTSPSPRIIFEKCLTDRTLAPEDDITATTDLQQLEFRFHAVGLATDQRDFQYRYRIVGLDDQQNEDEWINTTDTSIVIPTPGAGSYTFEAHVYDQNLTRSSQSLQVPFTIHPPYGRLALKGLAYCSTIACVFLGVLYVAKVRRTNRTLEEKVERRAAEIVNVQQEKQQLREELWQAQKMESLGTMAAGLAHEFNNSLSAIVSNAEFGILQSDDTDAVRKSLREVVFASERAAGITKSLLTFSGKSPSDRRPAELQRVVRESVQMVRGTVPKNIEVTLRLADEPIWCNVDEGQITQVLVNLIVNAKDAMPDGGRLAVTTELADDAPNFASIRVSDTGCGMTPDEEAHIFEPFFTTKNRGEGTGLGLSIVHSIVTHHQGTITVNSRVSEGTTFEIRIPICSDASAADADLEQSEPHYDFNSLRIVVGDDEIRVLKALSGVLRATGAEVIPVTTGSELLDACQQNADISLVIADIDMPERDGISVVRNLRQRDPDLPVIFITGIPSTVPRHLDEGPVTMLRKPFRMRELLGQVHRLARPGSVQY